VCKLQTAPPHLKPQTLNVKMEVLSNRTPATIGLAVLGVQLLDQVPLVPLEV